MHHAGIKRLRRGFATLESRATLSGNSVAREINEMRNRPSSPKPGEHHP
jgi:hypothetical protein